MRTLIQEIFKKIFKIKTKSPVKGFTFLEILLVLTLLFLFLGTTIPNFLNFFSKPHESEFKHIRNILKILRNDAIIKNNSYCIIFNLKTQKIMTSKKDETGKCETEYLYNPKILAPHSISDQINLIEARIAEENYFSVGKNSDLFEVHIDDSGFVKPFSLKFI